MSSQVIPAEAVDAALDAMRPLPPIKDRSRRRMVEVILEAGAPCILNTAAHDLAGADKTSHWDDMYQKLEEQDGGDLSSESTAYLNGIADAMRFLQARARP